jgi:hypothetical protein
MNERETKVHTCKRGHTTEVHRKPNGKWSMCPACVKAYREANREKVLEREKAYREANREKRKAYDEAYREAVKQLSPDDEIKLNRKAYLKAYYKANREKVLQCQKAYREADREKVLEYQKAYYEANRERLKDAARERRKRAKEKRENGDK